MKKVMCLLVVLGVFLQDAPKEPRGYEHIVPGWASGLSSTDHDQQTLQVAATGLRDAPLYRRVSTAPFLVERLANKTVVKMDDYVPSGRHDLRVVGGRAAYLLEEAFPVILPRVSASSSASELEVVVQSAIQQLDAFRSGVVDTVRSYSIGENVEELRGRFHKLIFQGINDDERSSGFGLNGSRAFEQMLEAFFPIGKQLSDLEDIVGVQAQAFDTTLTDRISSEGVTGVFLYSASNGLFGKAYVFWVVDGVIEAVNIKSIS